MPNTASAKKEKRKSEKRRALNRSQRSAMRTALKIARTAIEESSSEYGSKAERELAVKKLDQAAAKGLIHPNKAARLKSRLANKLKKHFPSERQDKSSAIKAQEVTMMGHGPRPTATRVWKDERSKSEIASVTYNQYADAFTIQWLADLNFDKAWSLLDEVFKHKEHQEGQVIAGVRSGDATKSDYRHATIRRGESMPAIISSIGSQVANIFSISLKIPRLSVTFFREASPSLSMANVISTEHDSIGPLLEFTLTRARSVSDRSDLASKMRLAVEELPSELRESLSSERFEPPEDGLELGTIDSE